MHKQDEKISAIEANTKLDLVSKILRLEEKLKDSDYKQKKSEKTIENMDKIIKELETKTRTKNEENLKDGHFSEKKEQENSNSEPAAVNVFQKTTNVSQDRSAAVGQSRREFLMEGCIPVSCLPALHVVKRCNILKEFDCIVLLYLIRHLLNCGFLIMQHISSHFMLILVNQRPHLVCTTRYLIQ